MKYSPRERQDEVFWHHYIVGAQWSIGLSGSIDRLGKAGE
jgi:hypothetical protein